jgi:hypothetical protein
MVILRGSNTWAHKAGGGVFTTKTLGEQFVLRLRNAGLVLESETAEDGEGRDQGEI